MSLFSGMASVTRWHILATQDATCSSRTGKGISGPVGWLSAALARRLHNTEEI